MPSTELSAKKDLLRSLMKCPHRKLEETIPVFKKALERDPLFAGKCFYALSLDEFNNIRDLEEAGISFLLTSPHTEHRDAGRIVFQKLPPFRAFRVGSFVRSYLKINRQVKGAVVDYLKTLESNQKRFDGASKVAGKNLHRLYEFYHIKPSKRAQTILFDRTVPEGEINPIDLLKTAKTPEEQANIIIDYGLPYRQATSAVKDLTPAIWVALIEVMTVPEAVNARASVEASGILKDNDIRELYESKLAKAGTSKSVAKTTIGERKSAKGTDERLNKILKTAEQQKIEAGARITSDTLIAVDVSGSMHDAIELAKRIGPQVASLSDGKLAVYCFNDTAWNIPYGDGSIEDFRNAFKLIRADGQTSLGIVLEKAQKDGFVPEQVVYITDQGENVRPQLVDKCKKMGEDIRFVFVTIGQSDHVTSQLERAGAEVMDFEFASKLDTPGWYSSMDNFVTLLTKGGYSNLVEKIMELELPKRK